MEPQWDEARQAEAIKILTDDTVERNRRYYHVREKFEVVDVAGVRRVRRKRDQLLMATSDLVPAIIRDMHVATGHKGETKTHKKIKEHYANIPMAAVKSFIENCERCAEKSKKKCARGVVVRPILASSLNERGQVDLIDYQSLPDGEYKFILHYKEHLTKFSICRPLKRKTAADVAAELLHIFLTFGAPRVLQSDNGREFTANIIDNLAEVWTDVVLINGKPRYPQSQGSVERGNCVVKDSLVAWMRDNKTSSWTSGLPFVQWGINTTYSEAIKMTPYEAVFGQKARMGLATAVPKDLLKGITNGMLEEEALKLLENVDSSPLSPSPPNVEAVEGKRVSLRIARNHVLCRIVIHQFFFTFFRKWRSPSPSRYVKKPQPSTRITTHLPLDGSPFPFHQKKSWARTPAC